ncbi:hypothetical protein ABTF55_20810, partial [Acinetobacter baumannii]
GNKSDINYFKSIFTQVDTAFKIDNKQITELEFKGNLHGVTVRTKTKSRKELYEAAYVTNHMFKSLMSKEVIVEDDPWAVNYNNNL